MVCFIRTSDPSQHYADLLTDSSGQWSKSRLSMDFQKTLKEFITTNDVALLDGDPRLLMTSSDSMLALRHGRFGLLIEVGVDATDLRQGMSHGLRRENIQDALSEVVSRCNEALETIQSEWGAAVEFFLVDGPLIYDYRLAACAFIPLVKNTSTGYYATQFPNDNNQQVQSIWASLKKAIR